MSESKAYTKEKADDEAYEFLNDNNHENSLQQVLRGQIKVKLKFNNNNKLIVNCLQCRNLVRYFVIYLF